MENRVRRSTAASMISVIATVGMNFLFVKQLQLGTLGLALAASLGQWVFLFVAAVYFLRGRSMFRFKPAFRDFGLLAEVFWVGLPNSLTTGFIAIRGVLVNALILRYVGEVGISAFSTANSFLGLFWAVSTGMLAVSHMVFANSRVGSQRD